jgi:hypothetical protein
MTLCAFKMTTSVTNQKDSLPASLDEALDFLKKGLVELQKCTPHEGLYASISFDLNRVLLRRNDVN